MKLSFNCYLLTSTSITIIHILEISKDWIMVIKVMHTDHDDNDDIDVNDKEEEKEECFMLLLIFKKPSSFSG